jgi:hypothetical protein
MHTQTHISIISVLSGCRRRSLRVCVMPPRNSSCSFKHGFHESTFVVDEEKCCGEPGKQQPLFYGDWFQLIDVTGNSVRPNTNTEKKLVWSKHAKQGSVSYIGGLCLLLFNFLNAMSISTGLQTKTLEGGLWICLKPAAKSFSSHSTSASGKVQVKYGDGVFLCTRSGTETSDGELVRVFRSPESHTYTTPHTTIPHHAATHHTLLSSCHTTPHHIHT